MRAEIRSIMEAAEAYKQLDGDAEISVTVAELQAIAQAMRLMRLLFALTIIMAAVLFAGIATLFMLARLAYG